MINVNDLLIEVKANQSRLHNEKGLLIREIFLLWYALVEGIECENFSESELAKMLHESAENFKKDYFGEKDCLFIVGWAASVAFWIFDMAFKEGDGQEMLISAYRSQPTNALFKWAIAHELKLSNKEVEGLIIELRNNFYNYYNYGPYIKEYFLDVISAPIR